MDIYISIQVDLAESHVVDTEPYFIEKKMEKESATETASEEGKKLKF